MKKKDEEQAGLFKASVQLSQRGEGRCLLHLGSEEARIQHGADLNESCPKLCIKIKRMQMSSRASNKSSSSWESVLSVRSA